MAYYYAEYKYRQKLYELGFRHVLFKSEIDGKVEWCLVSPEVQKLLVSERGYKKLCDHLTN